MEGRSDSEDDGEGDVARVGPGPWAGGSEGARVGARGPDMTRRGRRRGPCETAARYVGAATALGLAHWALHHANHRICESNIFMSLAFGDSRLCSTLRRGCVAVDAIAVAATAALVAGTVSRAVAVFDVAGVGSGVSA